MAESESSMFRRGMISSKASAKLKVLRGTKVQNSKMADFDDKGGRNDQGGIRDHGDKSLASSRHIDTHQDMGSPARASGKPSKGGRVGKYGQPGAGEINEASEQKPDWPKGGKGSTGRAGGRTVARIPRQGGQYGGGGRDTQ